MASSFFTFVHPTTIVIAGPTRSGKTHFVKNILKHSLIQPHPSRILWLFKEWQPAYDEIKILVPTIEFVNGIDNDKLDSVNASERNLVVLDDLMASAGDSKKISNLFTQEAHHRNLTVIFIIQNLFNQGKEMRNISLNAHYLVLYKNPRDKSQVRFLAHQVYPENSKFLINVFHHATEQPHSYLVLDLHPDTPENYRLLTNIFPGDRLRYFLPS
jgi:hypothetical protein